MASSVVWNPHSQQVMFEEKSEKMFRIIESLMYCLFIDCIDVNEGVLKMHLDIDVVSPKPLLSFVIIVTTKATTDVHREFRLSLQAQAKGKGIIAIL